MWTTWTMVPMRRVEHLARRSSRQDFNCAKARSPGALSRAWLRLNRTVNRRHFGSALTAAAPLVGGLAGRGFQGLEPGLAHLCSGVCHSIAAVCLASRSARRRPGLVRTAPPDPGVPGAKPSFASSTLPGSRAGGWRRSGFRGGPASTGRRPEGPFSTKRSGVGARQVGDACTHVVSVCGRVSRRVDGSSGKSAFGQRESPGVPKGLTEQASMTAGEPRWGPESPDRSDAPHKHRTGTSV